MPESPFLGKLPLDEMHMHLEQDRQESFESRIVESIFRSFGVSAPALRVMAKRINAGTSLKRYSMDWFNGLAEFPVKLAARRFHGKRRFSEFLKEFQLGTYFLTAPEISALADLQDGYPGEDVAFISRYPDWGIDLVFHTMELPVSEGSFQLQREAGGCVYRVEQLKTFLRGFTEAWRPKEVLTL